MHQNCNDSVLTCMYENFVVFSVHGHVRGLYCILACTGMYEDFKQYAESMRTENQVFELLTRYEQVCGDNVTLLKKITTNAVPGQHK